jgi:NAD(P)-dependent dehydrogenase (short-subunit alcohol dehydrogenase family)
VKTAFVTSGNRGIGRAIFTGLIAHGVDVTAGVRQAADGSEALATLGWEWIVLGISDKLSCRLVVEQITLR